MGSPRPPCITFSFDNYGPIPSSWVRDTRAERGGDMTQLVRRLWQEDQGQDIAEYAVMLAVILVLVVGTIRLIGGSANNVFSTTASSITQ